MIVENKRFDIIKNGEPIYYGNHAGVYFVLNGKLVFGVTDREYITIIVNDNSKPRFERVKYSGNVYLEKKEALEKIGGM